MEKCFTFALLKPDAVANPIVLKHFYEAMYNSGLFVSKACRMRLTHEQAENLYSIHKNRFFYSRLIRHVCSGPVIAMKLQLRQKLCSQIENTETKQIFKHAGNNSILNLFFTTKTKNKDSREPVEEEIVDLGCEEVISRWRRLLGPSKLFANCYKSPAQFGVKDFNNFRNFFALSDTRNCGHGSDSLTELTREYAIFKEFLVDVKDDAELFEFRKLSLDERKEPDENIVD